MNSTNLLINARAIAQLAAALPPWLPERGLTKSSDVTGAWLTKAIGTKAGNAVALSATQLDGTTGTTDRRRLVVEWDDKGKAAGLPAHLFVKSSPLGAKNRVMVAALDMAVNEVRFYRQAAQQLEDVVPRTWYAHAGNGAGFASCSTTSSPTVPSPMRWPITAMSRMLAGSSLLCSPAFDVLGEPTLCEGSGVGAPLE
jgi:hypothetical protein